ncbi:MAG: DUF3088 family protein [Syntrophobacteraceae bacterium]|nr:DUF3088 domain-containing protein [Desulfobacteraceae bacterium]
MRKHILFLLQPGFCDEKGGPFFCPDCATVEGFLRYAPEIEDRIEVRRIDFPRPRKEIVELAGEANQGCPVLVLGDVDELPPEAAGSGQTGKAFIAGSTGICEFLGRTFGVVRPHP